MLCKQRNHVNELPYVPSTLYNEKYYLCADPRVQLNSARSEQRAKESNDNQRFSTPLLLILREQACRHERSTPIPSFQDRIHIGIGRHREECPITFPSRKGHN